MIYTLKEWEKEMKMNRACSCPGLGSCLIPCPWCKIIGFYGPRIVGERKYRACKFCGWWQEIDNGEPYRCIALYCESCGIYDWTQPKEEKDFKPCEKCGLKYKKFQWAIDYPEHPFWDRKREIYKIHKYN